MPSQVIFYYPSAKCMTLSIVIKSYIFQLYDLKDYLKTQNIKNIVVCNAIDLFKIIPDIEPYSTVIQEPYSTVIQCSCEENSSSSRFSFLSPDIMFVAKAVDGCSAETSASFQTHLIVSHQRFIVFILNFNYKSAIKIRRVFVKHRSFVWRGQKVATGKLLYTLQPFAFSTMKNAKST